MTTGTIPFEEYKRQQREEKRKGTAPNPSAEQALNELAELSPVQFAQKRGALASKLGVPVTFLDREYNERRKHAKADGAREQAFLTDPEPWSEAVNGAALLDALKDAASRHLVLPHGGAETMALWTLFAHAYDCFDIAPVLAFTSPTPECGKTTCLTLLKRLVPRALTASNITASSLFRAVERWAPTILIDEADTFLRDSDELRGILNSGHQRASAFVIRCTGEDHEPKQFCTWAPKAIALIGKLPPTLASRSIHVELRRKLPRDWIEPLRLDRLEQFEPLQRKAARWAKDNAASLRSADPVMPEAIHGRAADNWRPLLAVAEQAGGEWPNRTRDIAERLSGRAEDVTLIMLLHDVAAIFAERTVDAFKSEDIVAALTKMEDRPWPEWKNGRPITTTQLARLLAPLGIGPKQIWMGKNERGYHRSWFEDAFARYLDNSVDMPTPVPSGFQPARPARPVENQPNIEPLNLLGPHPALAPQNPRNINKTKDSSTLAPQNPRQEAFGGMSAAYMGDAVVAFEERAASYEYDGGYTRAEAEALAAEEFPELPAFLDRRARP